MFYTGYCKESGVLILQGVITQPLVLTKPYIMSIAQLESAKTKKRVSNFHQATPKMRIRLFSMYLHYGVVMHIFPPQEILPNPFFINKLEQPFTK
jgi:hypothetical protein